MKIHTDKLSERTKKLLEEVLAEYGAKEIIRIEEDGTYDGYLDVDFMLENGWILSLHLDYNYPLLIITFPWRNTKRGGSRIVPPR